MGTWLPVSHFTRLGLQWLGLEALGWGGRGSAPRSRGTRLGGRVLSVGVGWGDCSGLGGVGEESSKANGAREQPLCGSSSFSPLPGSGSEALSAPATASKLRRFLLRQKRTFRCCSGGGGGSDSGQRPLPLTAASPSSPRRPRSPTSGKALGVWPGAGIKSRGAGPGQPLSPLPPHPRPAAPPPAAWAGPRMRRSASAARLAPLQPAC